MGNVGRNDSAERYQGCFAENLGTQGTERGTVSVIQGTIRAVCISPEKGTVKRPVESAVLIRDFGIENDAHAGKWHRQVSLLSRESVEAFNQSGAGVTDGDFGENLLVEGIDLKKLPVGAVLKTGTAVLRITQIGKECHSDCEIRRRTGDCIMPREGVFAEVLEGGEIRPGDVVTAQLPDPDRPFRAAVITLSDKGARGERKDESGPAAAQMPMAVKNDFTSMIYPSPGNSLPGISHSMRKGTASIWDFC